MHDIAEVDAPFAPIKPDEILPVSAPVSLGELVSPIPADAPPMPQTHFALGRPSARWNYRDAAGAVLFEVLRFDKPDGAKEFWPLTLWRDAQRGLRWRWKSVPAPRPLYNFDKLAARPAAPVVVCEGEKSADAAARIFPKSVAVTAPGGANASDEADWNVLRGRKVLVWPDDDAPGRAYARKVGATLAALVGPRTERMLRCIRSKCALWMPRSTRNKSSRELNGGRYLFRQLRLLVFTGGIPWLMQHP